MQRFNDGIMMSAWNPQPQSELEQKLMEVADVALDEAKRQGAGMSELSIDQGQGMSVTVRQGEVETVEYNRDKNLGVTVYFGHKSGSASTTDFSPDAIKSSVNSACNIAKFTEQDEFNGLADIELLATEFPDLDLSHPWAINMHQAIEIATLCEDAALTGDSRISNTEGATLSSHDGVDLYVNSNGFKGFARGSRHSASCSVIAGQGDEMQRDYWYDSKRYSGDLMPADEIGREAARRTIRRLDARKIKTGEHPVIFEPVVAASLLSHLISAISGSSLYRKASFLLDKRGQQIFPQTVQIYEQPLLSKAAGSAVFDSEGVATSENKIVRDGVLESYVLNCYAARKLGLKTTGNAGGVHNLTIESTVDDGLEKMIKDMGKGLVISELIGFGVNTVTGDYSRGAFGFWVENGEIQHPIQEFTIAGNLKEIFNGFVAVGSDVDERGNIRAGSILIEKMTVAGE
ncbi:metalloprotease PmbA [Candidatus Spongiihabitans sp.]|uniref:metalloprotease PmbA n=1 Tax=Candidatus Spongiihabitans sp. TaxID=3101308 RepID=UPI003C6F4E98